ncbi:hypothetical protein JTB14_009631 [Gonioctena quinquepunctata]|nr:hypothetical protein JTB14_009631 [Gonioctena quinquepunctata]
MAAASKVFPKSKLENNENNSEKKTTDSVKSNCTKKGSRVLVCINCYGYYHRSCDSHKIVCCDQKPHSCVQHSSDPDINLKMENTLLKELIAEVRNNNYVLRENNGLLLQRIRDLEEKVMTQKYKSKQKDDLQFSSSRTAQQGNKWNSHATVLPLPTRSAINYCSQAKQGR